VLRLILVCLALAVAGVAAGSGSATPWSSSAAPKCLKHAKRHGKVVCIKRAKPKAKPKPKPPVTTDDTTTEDTPEPADPRNGDYVVRTSQGATVGFTVNDGVVGVFQLDEIDMTCTSSTGVSTFLSGWRGLRASDTADLAASGAFSLSTDLGFGGRTEHLTIQGTVTAAGTASGSLTWTDSYVASDVTYSCASGTVAWSGGAGAAAATPAAPPALGHYAGTTSQGSRVLFDATQPDAYTHVSGLYFDEIDTDCSGGYVGWLKQVGFGTFFLSGGGRFHYSYHRPDGTYDITVDGTLDASGHASGTVDAVWVDSSGIRCASSPVPWTANRS
jgi:hypothetical protein